MKININERFEIENEDSYLDEDVSLFDREDAIFFPPKQEEKKETVDIGEEISKLKEKSLCANNFDLKREIDNIIYWYEQRNGVV